MKSNPKIKIKKINHVGISISDRTKSLKLYKDLLGLEIIPSMIEQDNIIWTKTSDGTMVHLVEPNTENGIILPDFHVAFEIENFEETLEILKTNWITYLSATSVYGDHNGEWVEENSKVNPLTENGKSRLNAEKTWINLAKKKNLPIQIFRLSGIYSQERNILEKIKSGSHQIINKPNHFFSRIHVEDISNVLKITLDSKYIKPGEIYNLSDDYPCSNIEIANYAYEMMKVSKPKMIEINEIKNEMLRNFYKDSKKVSNKKIKEVFSYKLKFPTYKKGLSRIYDHFI